MKTSLIGLTVVPLMALFALACSPPEPPDEFEIAMHRGGPEHTGVYDTKGVLEAPQVKWVFQTKAGIFSSAVVANNKVLFGSNDGNLYALDAETGRPVWTFLETGRPVRTSPSVADGVVYFGDDDGFISALNIGDGEVLWRIQLQGMIRSSPVIATGTVFLGSDSGLIHAFDAQTGLLIWETNLTSTRHIIRSSPAVVGDTIFVASIQVQPFGGALSDDPVRFESALFALERSTGDEVWSLPMEGFTRLPVATGGGAVFVATTRAIDDAPTRWIDGRLYAFEQSSGELRWMFHDEEVGAWTSPAVTEDHVLWRNTDGRLHALDILTGEVDWVFESGSQAFSLPSVADGLVYFGDNDGKVTGVDIATGQKRWEFQTAVDSTFCPPGFCGFEGTAPVISDGVLYVGNRAGYFYALESPGR